MTQQIKRRILIAFATALVSATTSLAQSPTPPEAFAIPINPASHAWQDAQLVGASKHRLYVITVDKPDRRQVCRVHSFTTGKLVCSRAVGGPRTYLPQQILALILPGDERWRIPMWLGFNAGLGAAIWGTVVLAPACPPCAAATGIAALFFFGAAGATAYADGQPDRLLYLAPGQELNRKFSYVER